MDFTVQRSRWLRGTRSGKLRDSLTGHMCCLGFVCQELGVSDKDMTEKQMPTDLYSAAKTKVVGVLLKAQPEGAYYEHLLASWVNKAASVNDNIVISEEDREETLINLFGANDHKLTFID